MTERFADARRAFRRIWRSTLSKIGGPEMDEVLISAYHGLIRGRPRPMTRISANSDLSL